MAEIDDVIGRPRRLAGAFVRIRPGVTMTEVSPHELWSEFLAAWPPQRVAPDDARGVHESRQGRRVYLLG